MAKNSVADLLCVDSLFTTQAERDEARRETVRDIPLEEISDFPNHPFKVRMDQAMEEMADSVRQYGVLVPALVRPKPEGGYEMVAGHRRRKASELAGKETLSCIVRELTDDEAIIVMVDSNLQREQLLPSEKWNTVTEKSFTNVLKKWQATVTKSDVETGSAQGNASLAGAVYGVYKGDQLIDSYTTDEKGQFTTGYYVCGDDWSIREISPSEGYLLDDTSHHVGAEPKLYTVEYNLTANDVTEQVIKGKIALIKHTDDGETQLETPEAGAEFAVYLKSAGSYDAAIDTERDYLICDENG